jgi:hypothetical protein
MEFDHIIRVNEDLTIDENLDMSTMDSGSYFDLAVDEDGTDIFEMSAGWTLLSGFTGQDGYNGPVMHAPEYVGGGLERHIRETPGYYVVLIVNALEPHVWQESRFTGTTTCERCGLLPLDADDMETTCQSDEPAGWAIAYKPLDD